jgi:hypothetical protein
MIMGLSIEVGYFADIKENDSEAFAEDFVNVAIMNSALSAHGASPYSENLDIEQIVGFDMLGYSGLHYVRRIAAHIAFGDIDCAPCTDGNYNDIYFKKWYEEHENYLDYKPGILQKIFGDKTKKPQFEHLMAHSDAEGYYVPVLFDDVLFPDVDGFPGGMFGSSYKLLEECKIIAKILEIPEGLTPDEPELHRAIFIQSGDSSGSFTNGRDCYPEKWKRFAVETYGCLVLIKAAEASIAESCAIVFC